MKPNYSIFKLTVFFILVALLFNNCKKPTDGITWTVDASVFKSPVLIQFENANSKSTTALPASFTVQITGQNADQVIMAAGGTDFTVMNGFLPLALVSTAKPSASNPVIFNVYASIPGFAPVSQTFSVTNDTLPVSHVLFAVEYASPPDGTSYTDQHDGLTNGVSGAVTISNPTVGSMTETSVITIPSGTQMLDGSGNLIPASDLESKVIHFGTGTQGSLLSFPGGFNPVDVSYNGQALHNVTFKTGGFLSINMVAGSTPVKNFSKPITVTSELNSSLINPLTNQPVQIGDSIPIWSMNEQTGQWKFEGNAAVAQSLTSTNKAVSFQASHLSCWNIDWWGTPCGSTLTVRVHIPSPAGFRPQYEMVLVDANEQYLGGLYTDNTWGTVETLYDGMVTVIPTLPNIGKVKLIVYTRRGDPTSKIAETALFAPCTQGTIDITINPPAPPQLVNVHLNVHGTCTNKNVIVNVTTWVYLYKLNAAWWDWIIVPVVNGQADLQLEQGAKYFVVTYYGGWYVTEGTFDKNNTNFPAQNGLQGTATYNAATNQVTADLGFNLTCQ